MFPEPGSNYFMTTRALLSQWITYVKAALRIDWNKRKSFDSSLSHNVRSALFHPHLSEEKGARRHFFSRRDKTGLWSIHHVTVLLAFTADVREILSALPVTLLLHATVGMTEELAAGRVQCLKWQDSWLGWPPGRVHMSLEDGCGRDQPSCFLSCISYAPLFRIIPFTAHPRLMYQKRDMGKSEWEILQMERKFFISDK